MKNKTTFSRTEVETMRLFVAEALLILSSPQQRSTPMILDALENKARCIMTERQAVGIIHDHDLATREAR